ncbi:MAG: hypothetical protein ACE3JK_01570 [Sporolactobacillus sp.]
MDNKYRYTLREILDLGLFTGWEIEDIVYESNEMWHLTFDWIGTLKENDWSVYYCDDPEMRQSLLSSAKRSALMEKCAAAAMKTTGFR